MRIPPAWSTALCGLVALALAVGVGRFAFTPILPMMLDDAGLTVAEGGWLASANYLGYLLGALSAIRLRLRAQTVIRGSLLLIALATLAMAFAQGFAAWLLLRLLPGIASAWVLVFVSAWALERLSVQGRPGLGGLVYGGVGAGICCAGLACLALLGWHAASATAWIALGVLTLVGTAFLWSAFSSPAVTASATPAAGPPLGAYWSLIVSYGAFGFGYIVPATFLPLMARRAIADPALFGWAWPLFGLAAFFSTLLASWLSRRIGLRRVWIAANVVMAIGVLAPVASPSLAGMLVAALCVGGTFMVATMAGLQEARALAGAGARPLIAAMTAAFAAGQIAGPLAAGWLLRGDGDFSIALSLAAGVLLLGAFTLYRIHNTTGTDHERTQVACRQA